MKTYIITLTLFMATGLFLVGCNNSEHKGEHTHQEGEPHERHDHENEEIGEEEVHLSEEQFQALGLKVDTLPMRNIGSYVEANGQLEVPPQNEAAITAIIGANITSIEVIEGDKVNKGQVLAYLSHPDLIRLQTDYVNDWNQLQYLEKQYERQRQLYDEKVGSGKELQKTKADYQSAKGMVKGHEAQLRLMGMSSDEVLEGEIFDQVAVVSPLDGHVRSVEVKTGQYVQPQTEMFEVVNIEHIHADLMVFEKDVHKVREGQRVLFSVESLLDKQMEAVIYAVGKSFEQEPKAIHIHAEIENKEGLLLPGMYVRGQILSEEDTSFALPEAGIVREGDKHFIFTASMNDDHGTIEWVFEPVEVSIGAKEDGWVQINLLESLPRDSKVAWSSAYYLIAEMKKGEAEHDH